MPAKKVMPASTSVDESIALQPAPKAAPTTEKCNVRRKPPRDWLHERDGEAMIAAAGCNRHAVRDKALILVCYWHGIRVAELDALEWAHVDFPASLLTVRRSKRGLDSTYPLTGRELRMLRALQRKARTAYVFESERGTPMSIRATQWTVEEAARDAGLPFPVHIHILRHSCGCKLANDGQPTRHIQHYLGHKSLNHIACYAALAPDPFRGFWRD
jgi:type 1 fimbriae regulatory protein FimB/type 1 fimbriae regulatory protein FimE